MDSANEDLEHKNSKLGFEDNGHIGYGLRENPKKSWKFSGFQDNTTTSMLENQCKVCGKEFESLKALYGHMRHHSGRERKRIECKECGKSFLSLKSLTNHARVHSQKLKVANESGTLSSSRHDLVVENLYVKRKRSKRKRYKSTTASTSISSLNESVSVTEIDQEVEQVALCLMMLSRGAHNWGEFYSFSEFSDNDQSVTFEVKSLNQKKRIVTNEGGEFVSNGNESFKMQKPREEKLDASVSDSLTVLYEQKEQKDELEVCIERFYEVGELEMPKLDPKSIFASYDSEIEKGILVEMKFKSTKVESCEDSMEEVGLDPAGLGIMKSSSSKKVCSDACVSEFGVDSCNKVKCSTPESEILDDSRKKCEIKCKTCNKMFHSRKALGGHRRMHSTKKSCMAVTIENLEEQSENVIFPETEADCKLVKLECIENIMERETGGVAVKSYESRESKEHKCPICFKVFITGQALGGHKRAHFLKNSETRPQQIAMSQEHSTICGELDINIPIMLDQEDNGDVGFKQWWVGSNCKPEPLVAN